MATTDPVVKTLQASIDDAKQEKSQLEDQVALIDSRIARLTTAIQVIRDTTPVKKTVTAIEQAPRKRTKRKNRPFFVAESTVDDVIRTITGAGRGKNITQLAELTGYSVASVHDAVKTLMERKLITRNIAPRNGQKAGGKSYLYWPAGDE